MTSNHYDYDETQDLYLDRTANDRMSCISCERDTADTFGDIDWQQHHGEQYCGDCVEAGEHKTLCVTCAEGGPAHAPSNDECECCYGRGCEHTAAADDATYERIREQRMGL